MWLPENIPLANHPINKCNSTGFFGAFDLTHRQMLNMGAGLWGLLWELGGYRAPERMQRQQASVKFNAIHEVE